MKKTMPLRTTVVGSWPKPDYLQKQDWFRREPSAGKKKSKCVPTMYSVFKNRVQSTGYDPVAAGGCEDDVLVERAIREIFQKQVHEGNI